LDVRLLQDEKPTQGARFAKKGLLLGIGRCARHQHGERPVSSSTPFEITQSCVYSIPACESYDSEPTLKKAETALLSQFSATTWTELSEYGFEWDEERTKHLNKPVIKLLKSAKWQKFSSFSAILFPTSEAVTGKSLFDRG
jgi:hypothetical protein